MKKVILPLLLLLITGCASTKESVKPVILPPIVQEKQIELPAIELPVIADEAKPPVKVLYEFPVQVPIKSSSTPPPPEPQQSYQEQVEAIPVKKPIRIILRTEDDNQTVYVAPGQLVLSIKPKMRVGIKSTIVARLTDSKGVELAKLGLSDTKVKPIIMSTYMTASMKTHDFEVDAKSKDDQVYDSRLGYTEWRWEVVPLKAGKDELELNFNVRIQSPNMPVDNKSIPVMQESVDVDPNYWWSIKRLLSKYCKEIVGGIGGILTAVFAVYKYFNRRSCNTP